MTRPTLLRAAEALARDLQAADVASPRRQAHVIARAAALMPELVAALRVTSERRAAGSVAAARLGAPDAWASVYGAWPGDETDEQLQAALTATDEQAARDADEE